MGRKAVSIKDVAKRARVSTATVSNVFSRSKPVSDDLAACVRCAADELGYRINRAASQLRTGKNRVVTVLVPDLSDPFFTSIITEIEGLAQLAGYEIIVANSGDDVSTETGRLAALMSWAPAGLIVIPCTDTLPERLLSEKDSVPIVLADRVADTSEMDAVLVDNTDAGEIAANYLTDLGHRDVLLAASDMALIAIRQRCGGAELALQRVGGRARVVEVGPDPVEGAQRLARWMERNDQPTAMIGMTDMTTLAILTALAKRKVEIPEEISVIGFDDYPWMSARETALTSVRQPIHEIARAIWDRLNARIEGDAAAPPKLVTLNCSLEIRDSVGAPKYSGNRGKEKRREGDSEEWLSREPIRRGKAPGPDARH